MAITPRSTGASRWERPYLTIALFLLAGGLITSASIGLPFALLGLALLALRPWRDLRSVFIPAILAMLSFIVVGMLVTPLGCSTSGSLVTNGRQEARASFTSCDNLLGLAYEGRGNYNPSQLPALAAGGAAAAVVAGASFILVRRAERHASPLGTHE